MARRNVKLIMLWDDTDYDRLILLERLKRPLESTADAQRHIERKLENSTNIPQSVTSGKHAFTLLDIKTSQIGRLYGIGKLIPNLLCDSFVSLPRMKVRLVQTPPIGPATFPREMSIDPQTYQEQIQQQRNGFLLPDGNVKAKSDVLLPELSIELVAFDTEDFVPPVTLSGIGRRVPLRSPHSSNEIQALTRDLKTRQVKRVQWEPYVAAPVAWFELHEMIWKTQTTLQLYSWAKRRVSQFQSELGKWRTDYADAEFYAQIVSKYIERVINPVIHAIRQQLIFRESQELQNAFSEFPLTSDEYTLFFLDFLDHPDDRTALALQFLDSFENTISSDILVEYHRQIKNTTSPLAMDAAVGENRTRLHSFKFYQDKLDQLFDERAQSLQWRLPVPETFIIGDLEQLMVQLIGIDDSYYVPKPRQTLDELFSLDLLSVDLKRLVEKAFENVTRKWILNSSRVIKQVDRQIIEERIQTIVQQRNFTQPLLIARNYLDVLAHILNDGSPSTTNTPRFFGVYEWFRRPRNNPGAFFNAAQNNPHSRLDYLKMAAYELPLYVDVDRVLFVQRSAIARLPPFTLVVNGLDGLLDEIEKASHEIVVSVTWQRFTKTNEGEGQFVNIYDTIRVESPSLELSHVFREYGHFAAIVKVEEYDVKTALSKELFTIHSPIVKVSDPHSVPASSMEIDE